MMLIPIDVSGRFVFGGLAWNLDLGIIRPELATEYETIQIKSVQGATCGSRINL